MKVIGTFTVVQLGHLQENYTLRFAGCYLFASLGETPKQCVVS